MQYAIANQSQMQQLNDSNVNYESLLQLYIQRLILTLQATAQAHTVVLNPEILLKELQAIIPELTKEMETEDAKKNFFKIAQEKKAKIILDEIEKKSSISDDEIKEQIKIDLMKRIDFFLQLRKSCQQEVQL